MSKKFGITIISDVADVLKKVNGFADNIAGNDVNELFHLHKALQEWEQKNNCFLTPHERCCFMMAFDRIEKLMDEFKITYEPYFITNTDQE